MRTMNFDAIATGAPLDRQASVVRDGSGDSWDARIPPGMDHWQAPPPSTERKPRDLEDMTARVFGRMTIIRYYGRREGKHARPLWLARCQCGDYETRRHETLKKGGNPEDRCYPCFRVMHLQQRAARAPNARDQRKAAAVFARIVGDAA